MEGGFLEGGRKANSRGKGEGKDARKPTRLFFFSDIRQIFVIAAEHIWWRFPIASKASW